MHTEDETFKALRRIPFRDMRNKAVSAKLAKMTVEYIDLDELFEANGWTREEYDAAVTASFNPEGIILKPVNPYKVHHVNHSQLR